MARTGRTPAHAARWRGRFMRSRREVAQIAGAEVGDAALTIVDLALDDDRRFDHGCLLQAAAQTGHADAVRVDLARSGTAHAAATSCFHASTRPRDAAGRRWARLLSPVVARAAAAGESRPPLSAGGCSTTAPLATDLLRVRGADRLPRRAPERTPGRRRGGRADRSPDRDGPRTARGRGRLLVPGPGDDVQARGRGPARRRRATRPAARAAVRAPEGGPWRVGRRRRRGRRRCGDRRGAGRRRAGRRGPRRAVRHRPGAGVRREPCCGRAGRRPGAPHAAGPPRLRRELRERGRTPGSLPPSSGPAACRRTCSRAGSSAACSSTRASAASTSGRPAPSS